MPEPKYFYMLIGLPGSGKSTWINNNVFGNTAILSTDQLIEDYASIKGKTYSEVFKEYIGVATDFFFSLIEQEVQAGRNILIDRTNMSVSVRKKILDMIPDDYIKVAIVVTCDEVDLQERLFNRPGKTIPWNVIESMKKSYQEPTKAEGFSSITYLNTSKMRNDE